MNIHKPAMTQKRITKACRVVLLQAFTLFQGLNCLCPPASAESSPAALAWPSANRFRVLLSVDARGRPRSNSPASVEMDFQQALGEQGARGSFDEHSVEIVAVSGPSRHVPHRIDRLFGASKVTVHFILPDE